MVWPSFADTRGRRSDGHGRLTLPVTINDGAVLHFAVDSAANASVLASDLVERLSVKPGGDVHINTLIDRELVASVMVDRLSTGAIEQADVRMVLADREALGGVDGLLGTDVLAAYRLVMNFRGRRMHVTRSRTSGGVFFDMGRLTVRYRAPAEERFNNLMLVDAHAGGTACKGIVDTGARITIVNTALAIAARARPLLTDGQPRRRAVFSPTGRSQEAEAALLPVLGFGGVSFRNVPVLVGDFHTFGVWGLADRPAALLGVDVLGLCQKVSIDLDRSELLLEV